MIVARDRERLERTAKQLRERDGIAVEVLVADLSQPAGVQAVAERIAADPALTMLVNNAGFGFIGSFAELDGEREEEVIRVNVAALTRLTRAALPGMIARGRGAIINVSSMAAFQPGPFNATYAATKAYVNSFTEALHEELRGTGVRVQALCPGFTRTEFQTRAGIDVSNLPAFVWMTADAVVDASLAALQRGDVVCVPGTANWLTANVIGMVPRGWTRRLSGRIGRRLRPAADTAGASSPPPAELTRWRRGSPRTGIADTAEAASLQLATTELGSAAGTLYARRRMNLFTLLDQFRPEEFYVLRRPALGLTAFIAIDDTRLGPACGGIRWRAYATPRTVRSTCCAWRAR